MRSSLSDMLSRILQQIRALLVTGHSLPDGLRAWADRTPDDPAATHALALAGLLEAGEPLSGAPASCGLEASPMVLTLVASGEKGEDLPGALEALVDFERARARLATRIEVATLYPRLVLATAA